MVRVFLETQHPSRGQVLLDNLVLVSFVLSNRVVKVLRATLFMSKLGSKHK